MKKNRFHSVLNKTASQMQRKAACLECEPFLTERDRENLQAMKRECHMFEGKIRMISRRDPGMSEKQCIAEFRCDHPNSDTVIAISGRCMKPGGSRE